jgi:hypothetical protein
MTQTANPTQPIELGTFEGFQKGATVPCLRNLSAADVIGWDRPEGEPFEFRPTTEDRLVTALFTGPVLPSELRLLVDLLPQLDGDRAEVLLWIQFVVRGLGFPISQLNLKLLRQNRPELFYGNTDEQAAKGAAMDLFEKDDAILFEAFMEDVMEILTFDWKQFLKKNYSLNYHAIVNEGSDKIFMVLTGYYFPNGQMTENLWE